MYEKNSLQNCDSLPPATIYILVGVFFVVWMTVLSTMLSTDYSRIVNDPRYNG